MAPHSSTLAWKITWTEEPGRLWSVGFLRVGHDWATSLSRIGEGNGNPLQCSCIENPRDRRAWWAAVYGVAELDTTEWLTLSLHFQTVLTPILGANTALTRVATQVSSGRHLFCKTFYGTPKLNLTVSYLVGSSLVFAVNLPGLFLHILIGFICTDMKNPIIRGRMAQLNLQVQLGRPQLSFWLGLVLLPVIKN